MKGNIRKMAFSAVVGAMYGALTMATGILSYGPMQLRVAEVLNILPFFFPETAVGLFVGCLLANLLSGYGVYDVVFGSLATLIAALLIAVLGKKFPRAKWAKGLACLLPAMINGPVIGLMIAFTTAPESLLWRYTLLYSIQIALSETVVMAVLGLPAMVWLPKSHLFFDIEDRLYGERKK